MNCRRGSPWRPPRGCWIALLLLPTCSLRFMALFGLHLHFPSCVEAWGNRERDLHAELGQRAMILLLEASAYFLRLQAKFAALQCFAKKKVPGLRSQLTPTVIESPGAPSSLEKFNGVETPPVATPRASKKSDDNATELAHVGPGPHWSVRLSKSLSRRQTLSRAC